MIKGSHAARRPGWLARLLVLSVSVLGGASLARGDTVPFDYIFSGTSPPVADSSAVLILDTQANRVWFSSHDRILGDVLVDGRVADSWVRLAGSPPRIIFQVRGSAVLQGNVLLDPYNRAVVDVVAGARRIRYLVTPAACAPCFACTFPSLAEAVSPVGTAMADEGPTPTGADMPVAPAPLDDEEVDPKYFFLGITNRESQHPDAEPAPPTANEEIVATLKKFSNWKDLKTYSAKEGEEKSAPIWLFDDKDGKQIGELLDQFKAEHTITKNDVFVFYYAGHTTSAKPPDPDGDEAAGGADVAFFKTGSNEVLRDDDLAKKVQAIGADDAEGVGTLRIVILDTCRAKQYYTGEKDLKTVKNVVLLWASDEFEGAFQHYWHDKITQVKAIGDIDKGITDDNGAVVEPAGNDQVNFEEFARWTNEFTIPRGTPGYVFDVAPAVYSRPVLKK